LHGAWSSSAQVGDLPLIHLWTRKWLSDRRMMKISIILSMNAVQRQIRGFPHNNQVHFLYDWFWPVLDTEMPISASHLCLSHRGCILTVSPLELVQNAMIGMISKEQRLILLFGLTCVLWQEYHWSDYFLGVDRSIVSQHNNE
jgi:hypothetical protein